MSSKKLTRRIVAVSLLLCLTASLAFAEDSQPLAAPALEASTPELPDLPAAGGLTRTQVRLVGGIPYLSLLGGIITTSLVPANLVELSLASFLLAGAIPHIVLDPLAGLSSVAISGLLSWTSLELHTRPGLYGDQSLTHLFQNLSLKTMMWSYYQGYATARLAARPEAYSQVFRPASLGELLAAPYNPAVLRLPAVWLPAALTSAAIIANNILGGSDEAIWTTGKTFIGQTEVPLVVGLLATTAIAMLNMGFTGIGEEALFRGIAYEEMKLSVGLWPARALDAALFAAAHVPQEVIAESTLGNIALLFAFRSVVTLGLQWAYDTGGLPASVAQHVWIDIISNLTSFLFSAGVADASAPAININLSFRLP
ncbi:MAG: hypothetical protein A2087_06940 [Spirochaetes bacterium GWD1_61_31]|nr:MAG: hypothetical protein A2Y37_08530 [Spirochaetes bacterium GWB1_60_80]OHD28466.1 MAG: hypothetical protein A2004_14725 [Spirochaetes bacterium GWC1_61_12]OHD40083.1 MAG: hypothetical protein A2087_06940 [Spirochaetes bacterium GWD1_61_31]OHD45869.1 MAG: hypothetical protein A2Y35_04165 [Spirochaetes bacterium GWE1_60_18]OHD58412.1 MAG: hypothetical protein A2Y32_06555 [Spirochaetes bacterium GWF1_60_12]HAW85393.1 hypothetical protein [Spirochaetaceae bacterium]